MGRPLVGQTVAFGTGFWAQNRRLSGKAIDRLRGQNIPHNAKTIDRTVGLNCIVSHKSTDVRCRSYESPCTVYRIAMGFVRELASYTGEIRRDHKVKATYHLHWAVEGEHCKRLLEWFVPLSRVPATHEAIFRRVRSDARALGVLVVIYRVKD